MNISGEVRRTNAREINRRDGERYRDAKRRRGNIVALIARLLAQSRELCRFNINSIASTRVVYLGRVIVDLSPTTSVPMNNHGATSRSIGISPRVTYPLAAVLFALRVLRARFLLPDCTRSRHAGACPHSARVYRLASLAPMTRSSTILSRDDESRSARNLRRNAHP